jgi:pre-mRNA-splicing factor SYF1
MMVTIFSTDVNYIASQAIARAQAIKTSQLNGNSEMNGEDAADTGGADAMAALERQARAPVGFVAASTGPQDGNQPVQPPPPAAPVANPDAIEVDVEDDDDDA